MKTQVTLTTSEAKRLIAKAIASLPETQHALKHGKLLLKGGTTVSALSEMLVGIPLRISGRITPRGTVSAKASSRGHPHTILIQGGKYKNIDDDVAEAVAGMGEGDVAVIGANAIDAHGNAAMMAGAPLGGMPGKAISGMMAEGVTIIVAAGLEKLIPGSVSEAVVAAGRKSVDVALGMGVGLIPLMGRLVTEREALELLAGVKCTVIGRGGISGAEGATTMVVEGKRVDVEKAMKIVRDGKGARVSGLEESLVECDEESPNCKLHLACIYKKEKKPP